MKILPTFLPLAMKQDGENKRLFEIYNINFGKLI
jgi:hypothetical protein